MKSRRTHTAAPMALALALACSAGAVGLFAGCEPPVSDEATLTITGTVLNEDGTPAASQEVELYRSELPIFSNDAVIAAVLANPNSAYETATTDAEGNFSFTLEGFEANISSGSFAAYFALGTLRGDDRLQAVATSDFQFSNQDLAYTAPDMQFWTGGEATVTDGEITFDWADPPTATRQGRTHVAIADSWFDATTEDSYSVSTLALPFDGAEHGYHTIALSNDVRYRSPERILDATNPIGPGIDYTQVDNNNISAEDCAGNNLFDLNDGEFARAEGVEEFATSGDDGARCVIITLPESTTLSDIVVRNGFVFGLESAGVAVSYRNDAADDWTVIDEQTGSTTDFGNYYRHLSGLAVDATQVRISVESPDDDHIFARLGEVTLYGPVP